MGTYSKACRYKQLQARLTKLNEQRQVQQKTLAQYKHLQSFLKPFKNPQENVQPNLVTKDGELNKELDRMMLLVARAGKKVIGLQGADRVYADRHEVALDSQAKLAALLGGMPASS